MKINIEDNFTSLCKKSSILCGDKINNLPDFSWAKNPYDLWFSRFFDFNISPNSERKIVLQIIDSIEKDNAPNTLLIKEDSMSDRLRNEIIENNFSEIVEQTAMSYDLSLIDFSFKDFKKVKIIDKVNDFKNWFRTVCSIFGEKNYKLFELFLNDKDIVFLGAFYDNQLVSTTMMFFQGDIVGLHLVGTLKEYRGKGLGSCITKFALKYASEMGSEQCVLQASRMGKSVYKKVGFNEYKKISHWKYQT